MTSDRGLAFGSIWGKEGGRYFARVDSFAIRDDKNWVLFSLWDVNHPGWQEGAALERHGEANFCGMYDEGPFTSAEISAMRPKIKFRITAVFEYEVNPQSFEGQGFGDNPTREEMLQIDRDNIWEIMSDELTAGDRVVLEIEDISNDR